MANRQTERSLPRLQLLARDRRRFRAAPSRKSSGLTAEGDAVDYREGTDAQHNVRKLVGLRKFSNITLKRGYTQGQLAVEVVHATSSTAVPTGATSPSC